MKTHPGVAACILAICCSPSQSASSVSIWPTESTRGQYSRPFCLHFWTSILSLSITLIQTVWRWSSLKEIYAYRIDIYQYAYVYKYTNIKSYHTINKLICINVYLYINTNKYIWLCGFCICASLFGFFNDYVILRHSYRTPRSTNTSLKLVVAKKKQSKSIKSY